MFIYYGDTTMKDRNGTKIEVGMRVRYQIGTKNESTFTLRVDEKGTRRIHFPAGDGASMEGCSIRAGWHQASDGPISEVI